MVLSKQFFFLVLWVLVSGSFSRTWSSTINSMFSSKIMATMGDRLVDSVGSGIQMAMDHCKEEFKWHRWNCPEATFSRNKKQPLTKEVAFARAIISAGIVHSIAKNCSRGQFENCGCNSNLEIENITLPNEVSVSLTAEDFKNSGLSKETKEWSWGGCSDDPSYAEKEAKKFLDGLEEGSDALAFAGKHNNRVGRQIIKETMVKKCRCHGVSGSCTLKTCWMQVASFEEIAKVLKERYNKAVRISFEQIRGARMIGNAAISARQALENKVTNINLKHLIYLEDSPDYCVENITENWPGTYGRLCSRSHNETSSLAEKRSCRNLCRACGHRVRKQKKKITFRCNCQFQWCCEVKCETCTETVDEFFCD